MFNKEDYTYILEVVKSNNQNQIDNFENTKINGKVLRESIFPNFKFYPKQREIFDNVFDQLNVAEGNSATRIQVIGAYGVGKSRFLAYIIIGYMVYCALKYNDKIFKGRIFSGKYSQLMNVTWEEIKHVLMNSAVKDLFVQRHSDIRYIDNDNIKVLPETFDPSNPDSVQGLHTETGGNLVVFFDEGSAIPNNLYNKIETFFTSGRCLWLVCGNPTRKANEKGEPIEFYKTYLSNRWKSFVWTIFDNLSEGESSMFEEYMRDKYGVDSDPYRVAVLAQFPEADVGGLIPSYYLDIAATRPITVNKRPVIMAIDPATGSVPQSSQKLNQDIPITDECAIVVMNPVSVLDRFTGVFSSSAAVNRSAGMQQTFRDFKNLVHQWIAMHQPTRIVIDAVGVGADFANELYLEYDGKINNFRERIEVIPFVGNGKPQIHFGMKDRRTEVAFQAAEWLANVGHYPECEEFRKECMGLVTHDEGDRTCLISKKKLPKSPNRWDAFSMCFAKPFEGIREAPYYNRYRNSFIPRR
jgi:hypothetical protein